MNASPLTHDPSPPSAPVRRRTGFNLGRLISGLSVFTVGLLILLDQREIVDIWRIVHLWPVLVILLGLGMLFDRDDDNPPWFAIAVTGAGIMLLLSGAAILWQAWRDPAARARPRRDPALNHPPTAPAPSTEEPRDVR
ncbi:MAG: hypothetical protein AAF772_07590 [Acidobacteriota bacterium]